MMTFNNPRFKPRPIYIRADVDSNNKQVTAEFEHALSGVPEKTLIERYSALINELVDLTIVFVINHFEYTTRKESLVDKYTEELLNDLTATKLYYEGQDVTGHPIFEIRIKFSKKLEKHWNTYTHCLMRAGRNKMRFPLPIYYKKHLKGNNYMTLRFTYETSSNWYRFQLCKVKNISIPDEDNIKVHFVVWKQDRPEVPYHKVRESLTNNSQQVWNGDMTARIDLNKRGDRV